MKLQTRPYCEQKRIWPAAGRHIMAHYDEVSIVVYQAYCPAIGNFAVEHGYFGGEFSYNRMSWCKPNFLWMMYRSGWGTKEGQEITLAVRLKRDFFDKILEQAVPAGYEAEIYPDKAAWSKAVPASDVRLQWDPDHSPMGGPLERRAIQLGLRGAMLREYGREAIIEIEDISDFVATQRTFIGSPELSTPFESIYRPDNVAIVERLQLSNEF